jgi:wyosine [tRNA(Phe)-imidazoG37] synthetase (radical SAM superfamily)
VESFKPFWKPFMNDHFPKRKNVFGPVPSRRLGRSLGIDLVPFKTCTFDCIYCDLGRTLQKTVSREMFVSPEEIERELQITLDSLERKPDFVTISGSGETTLHSGVQTIIHAIKNLTSVPVAVLTNGSLLFLDEVRKQLLDADVVLPSLDAASPLIFKHINRPHPLLTLDHLLSGLIQFRKEFHHQIWLETLFCRGINDQGDEIEALRRAMDRIQPDRIQVNTSVRPPAESYAYPLSSDQLEEIRKKLGDKAEVIAEPAGPLGESIDSGKESEILELIRRRPCTVEDVSRALGLHKNQVIKHLQRLMNQGMIHYRLYQHQGYYEKTPLN